MTVAEYQQFLNTLSTEGLLTRALQKVREINRNNADPAAARRAIDKSWELAQIYDVIDSRQLTIDDLSSPTGL